MAYDFGNITGDQDIKESCIDSVDALSYGGESHQYSYASNDAASFTSYSMTEFSMLNSFTSEVQDPHKINIQNELDTLDMSVSSNKANEPENSLVPFDEEHDDQVLHISNSAELCSENEILDLKNHGLERVDSFKLSVVTNELDADFGDRESEIETPPSSNRSASKRKLQKLHNDTIKNIQFRKRMSEDYADDNVTSISGIDMHNATIDDTIQF